MRLRKMVEKGGEARERWRGGGSGGEGEKMDGRETYHPVAADVALLDGQTIVGADVLPKGALATGSDVGSREGGGGEGEDGGGELHLV